MLNLTTCRNVLESLLSLLLMFIKSLRQNLSHLEGNLMLTECTSKAIGERNGKKSREMNAS